MARMKCSDYTVGWICAVHVEYVVAAGMLDEEHDDQMQPLTEWDDENSYTFGRIGPHNVVITCLPIGKYGIAAAAVAATHMKRSFKCIRMGLMVGIGGGVPSKNHDVRLGDIVIGACAGLTGSVLDYDHGKVMPDGKLQLTKHTDKPPSVLLNALSKLRRDHELRGNMIVSYIKDMMEKNRLLQSERRYNRPPPEEDRLYETSYQHVNEDLRCAECCEPRLVNRGRSRMNPDNPVVHYGRIASASKLMKDARYRDQMADEHEVLCFEMEAAGLDDFHCLIIRGICDYADSHKNDTWQGYAAAAAAGYAKELLHAIPSKAIHESHPTPILNQAEPDYFGRNFATPNASTPILNGSVASPSPVPNGMTVSQPLNNGMVASPAPLYRSGSSSSSIPDLSVSQVSQEGSSDSSVSLPVRPHALSQVSTQDSFKSFDSSMSSDSLSIPGYPLSQTVSEESLLPGHEYDCLSLNVPSPINTFVMREEDMQKIRRCFRQRTNSQKSIQRMALRGMGGSGKTQLAAKYCHDSAEEKRYDYIVWLNASEPNLLELDIEQIAHQLPQKRHFLSSRLKEASDCLSFLHELLSQADSWLMVFDNFDEPKPFRKNLDKYIPSIIAGHGRVLITSQLDEQGLKPFVDTVLDVEKMQPQEAEELLFVRSNNQSDDEQIRNDRLSDEQETAWKELLKQLDYHALTVDILASHILTGTLTAKECLQQVDAALKLDTDSSYDRTSDEVCKLALNRIAGPEETMKRDAYLMVLAIFVHIRDHPIMKDWFFYYAAVAAQLGEVRPWMKYFLKDGSDYELCPIKFGQGLRDLTRRSIIKDVGGSENSSGPTGFTMHRIMRHCLESYLKVQKYGTSTLYESSELDAVSMLFLWWNKIHGPKMGHSRSSKVFEIKTLLITTCTGQRVRDKDEVYEFNVLDRIAPTVERLEAVARREGFPKIARRIWYGRKFWKWAQYPSLVGPKSYAQHQRDQIFKSFSRK